ncbi:MAG: UvrD-helicase domain-containing protein, partial [Burkholderiales bacterium]
AVRALGDAERPTDLLLALDTRIRHILVDEFQDTSYSQWQLLERLTAGWDKGDGRTLFVVGDPMQSIYRFREANVALFLRAWEEGIGTVALEPLRLSTNFRSQAGLVDWYNAAFPDILPREADPATGAVPYSAAAAHPKNAPLEGDAVTWHHVADRAREAERVVSLVRSAEHRAAILVRNRSALADIVPALKQAGIRYRAIEIEQLGEKQVVQDLYALTRALLHLGDRIAWLSILRAPWLALPLDRLLEIAGGDRTKTIWEIIKDDLFLSQFTAILAPAIANRARGSLRDAVEGVWLALGGPACVPDKTALEDAERYLDALSDLEDSGPITDLAHLRDALERLYALPDVDATDDDLQIMTIHKAKGLEFGTVIVPGLDQGPGGGDPDLLLFHELVASGRPPVKGGSEPKASGGLGLLLAPIKATGSDSDPTYRYLARLDTEAEDTEASRLLYVAATRAEHRLHLLACLGCDKDGNLKRPTSHTLLSRAWPAAEASFQTKHQTAAQPVPARENNSINRLPTSFSLPSLPTQVKRTVPSEGRDGEEIEFSWASETARHVGTVVHRWLQRMADDELKGWDAKRVDALTGSFRRELQRRGMRAADNYSAAELVRTALKNSLSDERGRWVLGTHPESQTEQRLRARTKDGMRTYIIDRLFRDRDNVQWIVDFKTSRHEGGGLEEFLDVQKNRYQPQLNTYAGAYERARLGIYFPILRGWREWTK